VQDASPPSPPQWAQLAGLRTRFSAKLTLVRKHETPTHIHHAHIQMYNVYPYYPQIHITRITILLYYSNSSKLERHLSIVRFREERVQKKSLNPTEKILFSRVARFEHFPKPYSKRKSLNDSEGLIYIKPPLPRKKLAYSNSKSTARTFSGTIDQILCCIGRSSNWKSINLRRVVSWLWGMAVV
jgi:hypothetical protein